MGSHSRTTEPGSRARASCFGWSSVWLVGSDRLLRFRHARGSALPFGRCPCSLPHGHKRRARLTCLATEDDAIPELPDLDILADALACRSVGPPGPRIGCHPAPRHARHDGRAGGPRGPGGPVGAAPWQVPAVRPRARPSRHQPDAHRPAGHGPSRCQGIRRDRVRDDPRAAVHTPRRRRAMDRRRRRHPR